MFESGLIQYFPSIPLSVLMRSVLSAGSEAPTPSNSSRPKDGERALTGIRILVADDSPDNQLLIERYLTLEGATVEIAVNGLEAVDKALRGDFHIILMDVMMPLCDGYDATRRLRVSGFNKPIVALTAHALGEERARSFAEGCNEHLTKPINRRLLISTVEKFVFRHS